MKKSITILCTLLLVIALSCGVVFAMDSDGIAGSMNQLKAVDAITVLGILGVLTFATELVVQLTKELPGVRKIPTKLYVITVSLLLSEVSLFVFAAWAEMVILWYYIVLAAFMAFVIAYVSMFGWDALKELYERCIKGNSGVKA